MEETDFSCIGREIESVFSRQRCGCWEDKAKEVEICRGAGGVLPLSEDVGVSGVGTEGRSERQELEERGKEVGNGELSGH